MALYKIDDNKVKQVEIKNFKNEKELQTLCEKNLEEFFQVRFIATEFPFADEYSGRLDTIGLDYEGNPVIIEYKLDTNSAIISQVLFYMDWLVNHHGDFEIAAKKTLGNNIKINWDNPKMILVAQDYNKYDKYAVNQIQYDVYLYKYIYYKSNEIYLENINVQDNKKYSITNKINKTTNKTKYERKEYDIDFHLNKSSEDIKELYKELDEKILDISDQIEKRILKMYIGYRTTKNFVEIHIYKNFMQILLTDIEYNDPKHLIEKVPDSFRWSLNKRMNISNREDLEYAINLIKQSYNSTL